MGKIAVLFPGQGSQYVGMGQQLLADRPELAGMYRAAAEILGYDLAALTARGPEEELRRTRHTQPALFVASLAAWQWLRLGLAESGLEAWDPDYAAGHSLGEYSAVVAAGCLAFSAGLALVAKRAQWMEEDAQAQPGAMAAVLGLEAAVVQDIAAEVSAGGEVLVAANFNGPGQVVVSGTPAGVERAGALARERGARRVVPLAVGGAFHSPLMARAAARMRAELARQSFADPRFPVLSNVRGLPASSAAEVSEGLAAQMESPVRWQQNVEWLVAAGVDTFIEVGPGQVLTGLVRKCAPQARTLHVEDPQSGQLTLDFLKGAL